MGVRTPAGSRVSTRSVSGCGGKERLGMHRNEVIMFYSEMTRTSSALNILYGAPQLLHHQRLRGFIHPKINSLFSLSFLEIDCTETIKLLIYYDCLMSIHCR